MKQITPGEYAKLSTTEREDWVPEYAGFKTKKVRDYAICDYGHQHYVGWRTIKTPVGVPASYRPLTVDETLNRDMTRAYAHAFSSLLDMRYHKR